MSETNPIDNAPVFIVTMDDRTLFCCTLTVVGGYGTPDEARWMLTGTDGTDHVGPLATLDATAEDVRRTVAAWWDAKKAAERVGDRETASAIRSTSAVAMQSETRS